MTRSVPATPGTAPVGAALAADFIDVDLSAPTSYEGGPPLAALAALRAKAPVAWHAEQPIADMPPVPLGGELIDSPGFWAITSHEYVDHISRNPEIFSSWLGGVSLPSFDQAALDATRHMLLNMDPPEHTQLRRLLAPIFKPGTVRSLRDSVDQHCREIVAAVPDDNACEFVSAVAAELPIRVLSSVLGMPYEDRHLIYEWSSALTSIEDPETTDFQPAIDASIEMSTYGMAMATARRAEPKDDLISLVANGEVDGTKLTDGEFAAFWNLLVLAGNETTRNALSGGMIALCENGLWENLRANRNLVPTAVEEILRYVSPVMHFRRTAAVDTELGGQQIRAGDKVVLFYSAANRDPEVFENPDEFRLDRSPNPHLALGVGPHFCLGAHLARLEMITLLNELLDRFSKAQISGSVIRTRSVFLNIVRELPVSFNAAS